MTLKRDGRSLVGLVFLIFVGGLTGCDLRSPVSAEQTPGAADLGGGVVDRGTTPVEAGVRLDVGGILDDRGVTWPICATTTGEGQSISGGVDIIWFIDTSNSMKQETAWVQQNLNNFATYIGNLKLDYRVLLIGAQSICVPPPLGGQNCTDGQRYRHIKESVGSKNGLSKIMDTYPQWRGFLRQETAKNFVAVTDDNSDKSASWFTTALAALSSPGFLKGFTFHSIVSFGLYAKGCDTGASVGQVYLDLTSKTGGQKHKICEKDWKSIFQKLAQGVVSSTKPPCSYLIPDPGTGKQVNLSLVKVSHLKNQVTTNLTRVPSATQCTSGMQWHYDDPTAPKRVVFCPKTCATISGGKVIVKFGCFKGPS